VIQKLVITKENSSWNDSGECRKNLKNDIINSDWSADYIKARELLLPTSVDIDFDNLTQTYTETRTWSNPEALSAYQSAISSTTIENIENHLKQQRGWNITETTVDS
jgi:hypothetical protein